jgi:hypothetical protein
MSINNTAYATWTSGGDVLVARLDRTTNAWTVLPGVADVVPSATAGVGADRSRVSVSADGVALIVWGEEGADGRTHVYARKAFGPRLSTSPQDLTPATGGSADTPDVDAEDDSSFAWVVFRQIVDGAPRILARRQRGTQFDDPVVVDGGNASDRPRIAISGRGDGLASMTGGAAGLGAVLRQDAFAPTFAFGVPAATLTAPAMAENSDGIIAWAQPGGVGLRPFDAGKPQPDVALVRPELGPVDLDGGFDAAVDRADDGVVVWTQGSASSRSLVAGYSDRPPLAFTLTSNSKWRNPALAPLRWSGAFDLFGPLTYTVLVAGRPVGQTGQTLFKPTGPLPEGVHKWRVIATDARGQTTSSRSKTIRIDMTPPTLTVNVSRSHGVSRIKWRAADVTRPLGASGIDRVRLDFGDGAQPLTLGRRGTVTHRYKRTSTLSVTAIDAAGNKTVVKREIRRRR